MTNFAWGHPESVGAFKGIGSHLPELPKPKCTWLLTATADIKPAGSKHQWSQRQMLPVAGAALSWSCFSHEQLHVLPGAAEIDDSLLSWAVLGCPARVSSFRRISLFSTGTLAQTECLSLLDQKKPALTNMGMRHNLINKLCGPLWGRLYMGVE